MTKKLLTDAQANKLYDTVKELGIPYIPHKLIAKGAQEVEQLLNKKEVELFPLEQDDLGYFLKSPESYFQTLIGVKLTRGTTIRHEDSLVQCFKALKTSQKSKGEIPWQILCNIGTTYISLSKAGEAIPFLEKALNSSNLSENIKSEIIYRLGLSYFESGAFSQACSYFERILNSSHMSENRKKQLSYYMGECCFNLEEYNKALEYYISILKLTSLSFDYRSMLYSKIAGTSQLAKKQLTENSDLN